MKILAMPAALALGLSCFAVPEMATAQDALSSCNPVTGLTPAGTQCVTLTRVDPTRYQTPIDGEGAANYRPVDVDALVETYECNPATGAAGYGAGGDILIEDCGQPISLDPATFKEFVGYSGNAAPAPAPVYAAPPPPPPAPVYVAPPAPVYAAPVALPPAPPIYAPVMATTGLGNAGLLTAGLGAAAFIGIAALAFGGDDDDDSTVSTTSTN